MKDRKPIFFTADFHLGHKNVILFDKRPFTDISHMHRVLVNNYNSTATDDSIVYFLGDMGMCGSELMKKEISQLKGTKILILGNHDKGVNAMYRLGFDAVIYSAHMLIANEKVSLSHCPLRKIVREDITGMRGAKEGESWHGESRHDRYSLTNEGQFHLHGHVHSKPENKILGRQYDVGVRANKYRPVNISEIESWIAKTRKDEKQ